MADDITILSTMYDRFNARDIDGVLGALNDDVAWANGMEGGHVHGREGVREYWTRQWASIVRIGQAVWALNGAVISTGAFETS